MVDLASSSSSAAATVSVLDRRYGRLEYEGGVQGNQPMSVD